MVFIEIIPVLKLTLQFLEAAERQDRAAIKSGHLPGIERQVPGRIRFVVAWSLSVAVAHS